MKKEKKMVMCLFIQMYENSQLQLYLTEHEN